MISYALEVKNLEKSDSIVQMLVSCVRRIHKIGVNFSPKFLNLYASIYVMLTENNSHQNKKGLKTFESSNQFLIVFSHDCEMRDRKKVNVFFSFSLSHSVISSSSNVFCVIKT